MPRKSKKATFRGVPFWKKQSESVDSETACGSAVPSTSHQNEQLHMARDIASSSKCEERLQTSFDNEENANISITDATKGYRLIDLQCLADALLTVHKCPAGKLFF